MFQVEWKEQARDELTRWWLNADGAARRLITETVSEFDVTLGRSADAAGESRFRLSERILCHLPLEVLFEVENRSGQPVEIVMQVWPVYEPSKGS